MHCAVELLPQNFLPARRAAVRAMETERLPPPLLFAFLVLVQSETSEPVRQNGTFKEAPQCNATQHGFCKGNTAAEDGGNKITFKVKGFLCVNNQPELAVRERNNERRTW